MEEHDISISVTSKERDTMLETLERNQYTPKEMEWFFKNNLDQNGNQIPSSIQLNELAKSISPKGELFIFDYGVVVFWGFTEAQESLILDSFKQYQNESLGINH